jgi:hypothetical protein
LAKKKGCRDILSSSSPRLSRRWDSKSLIQFIQGVLSLGLNGTSINLTIHIHLVPKLKIRGALVSFPINVVVPWLYLGILDFIVFGTQFYQQSCWTLSLYRVKWKNY